MEDELDESLNLDDVNEDLDRDSLANEGIRTSA